MVLPLFSTYLILLMLGVLLLIWVILRTIKDQRVRTPDEFALVAKPGSCYLGLRTCRKGFRREMNSRLLPDPNWINSRIAEEPYWFHRLRLPGGIVTPDWSDPSVDKLPHFG